MEQQTQKCPIAAVNYHSEKRIKHSKLKEKPSVHWAGMLHRLAL